MSGNSLDPIEDSGTNGIEASKVKIEVETKKKGKANLLPLSQSYRNDLQLDLTK